ncbi:hypothetical protein STRDD11_01188 [Streptococcus sp. DD11]|nr:hypothetical protein STRDD11_01188 [Streptococcus sp. DD11]
MCDNHFAADISETVSNRAGLKLEKQRENNLKSTQKLFTKNMEKHIIKTS